jgi:hypothetical protein
MRPFEDFNMVGLRHSDFADVNGIKPATAEQSCRTRRQNLVQQD